MDASEIYVCTHYEAYTSECFRCVNIFPICILSGWNPVFTESRAANSSLLHPSISPCDACYPEVEDETKRQNETILFMYARGSMCVYTREHASHLLP